MIYISCPMYFDALNTIIVFYKWKHKKLPSFWPENAQFFGKRRQWLSFRQILNVFGPKWWQIVIFSLIILDIRIQRIEIHGARYINHHISKCNFCQFISFYTHFQSKSAKVNDMLEQYKCDIRDQHGLEHISHCVRFRIDDFCIFTPRTMHPSGQRYYASAYFDRTKSYFGK